MFEVDARELSKSYGRTRALDDVSFRLPPGSLTRVAGANGAGKSTLLDCLAGISYPDSGSVVIRGDGDLTFSPRTFCGRIGYAGTEPLLYGDMTLTENFSLLLVAATRSLPEPNRLERRLAEEIERFSVGSALQKRIGQCSTGIKQRAGLVRALFHDPALIILDEPSANLDAQGKAALTDAIQFARARRATVIFAAHQSDLFADTFDGEVALHDGRLIRNSYLQSNDTDAPRSIARGER